MWTLDEYLLFLAKSSEFSFGAYKLSRLKENKYKMREAVCTGRNALPNARLIYTSVQASARVSQRRLRRSRTRRLLLA